MVEPVEAVDIPVIEPEVRRGAADHVLHEGEVVDIVVEVAEPVTEPLHAESGYAGELRRRHRRADDAEELAAEADDGGAARAVRPAGRRGNARRAAADLHAEIGHRAPPA